MTTLIETDLAKQSHRKSLPWVSSKRRKRVMTRVISHGLLLAVGLLFLLPFLNETVLGLMLAAVAGIMVFISLDELVPVARSFGEEHLSIVGVGLGMVVMAASLWMLK